MKNVFAYKFCSKTYPELYCLLVSNKLKNVIENLKEEIKE